MKKCLMIQTKDHKKFFTHERNLPQLMEFSRVFNAEISIVQLQNDNVVLELEELAPALCEKKDSKEKNYKILEVKVKAKYKRNKAIKRAHNIQKYIASRLQDGTVLSLKEITQKYKRHQLTTACLCIHFRKTRENLAQQGLSFQNVGRGKYQLIQN